MLVGFTWATAARLLGSATAEKSGIISGHAHSVLKEREVKRKRFVLIRYDLLCLKY